MAGVGKSNKLEIPMLLLLLRVQFCFRTKRIGHSSYNYMSINNARVSQDNPLNTGVHFRMLAIAANGLSAGQPFEEASPQDSPLKRLTGGCRLLVNTSQVA